MWHGISICISWRTATDPLHLLIVHGFAFGGQGTIRIGVTVVSKNEVLSLSQQDSQFLANNFWHRPFFPRMKMKTKMKVKRKMKKVKSRSLKCRWEHLKSSSRRISVSVVSLSVTLVCLSFLWNIQCWGYCLCYLIQKTEQAFSINHAWFEVSTTALLSLHFLLLPTLSFCYFFYRTHHKLNNLACDL